MRKIVAALLIIVSLTSLVGVTYAVGGNATNSAGPRSEVAQRARQRLQQLMDSRATASASISARSGISKALSAIERIRRRAHVFGVVTAISGNNLTIQTLGGEIKTVFTDENTKFFQVGKGGKKKITLDDLKIGDKIAAVGIVNDEDSGTAFLIVKFNRPMVRRHAVFGQVTKASDNELTVSHIFHKNRPTTTIKVTSNTVIQIKGDASSTFADIKVGDIVVASGTVDSQGVITAKVVFVIPGKFLGIKPKEATGSATHSATTSAAP